MPTDFNAETIKLLHDAAEHALDVLLHCVVPGGGCDDARDRDGAIAALTTAIAASKITAPAATRTESP